jgi:hypothetical protein
VEQCPQKSSWIPSVNRKLTRRHHFSHLWGRIVMIRAVAKPCCRVQDPLLIDLATVPMPLNNQEIGVVLRLYSSSMHLSTVPMSLNNQEIGVFLRLYSSSMRLCCLQIPRRMVLGEPPAKPSRAYGKDERFRIVSGSI